ncbi:Bbp16 family capsid cement protein [Paenalcaligenes suwonensis]|uniref:Bbp16 family capsid cement protein n=1 Tax=Paenalcaligenes suwonensis TaxID=1202713 RepID=UPI00140B24C4|nr:hypothetical protein [Paenalcaligenes suwonensis]NHC63181.1 hypothetical protein [Paenalcaligenes suwonensis]
MYIDSRLELSTKQVVAAAGPSTNAIDVGEPRKLGPGQPMYVVVQTDAVVAADVTVAVQTADAAGFAGAADIASVLIPANTPAGARFVIGFPYTSKRFLRLNYDAAITASAWLTSQEPQSWESYPAQV